MDNHTTSLKIDPRSKESKLESFQKALQFVTNQHLANLNQYDVVPFPEDFDDVEEYSRFFQLTDVVYAKDEDFLEKAVTVLYTAYALGATVSVLLRSDGSKHDYFLGVSAPDDEEIAGKFDAFYRSFKGNFSSNAAAKQGEDRLTNSTLEEQMNHIFSGTDQYVTSISGSPALRNADKHSVEKFIQGIEQLTEGLRGSSYSIMIQADPISSQEVQEIRQSYEQIYTSLSPFARTECSFNASENWGTSTNESSSDNSSTTETTGTSYTKTDNILGKTVEGLKVAVDGVATGKGGVLASIRDMLFSYGYSESHGESPSKGETHGTSSTVGTGTNEGGGTGRSIQYSFEDKTIQGIQETLDENLKRLRQCENYGTFSSCVYVISDDYSTNQTVSSMFEALMRGDTSFTQGSYIHTWERGDKGISTIKQYLSHLQHPHFQYPMGEQMAEITPAMIISGEELALQIGLPKKSITGVIVRESARFGCNPMTLDPIKENDKTFSLGQVYHLGQKIETPISLSWNEMTGHTFITGSTGSGKSNTVYQILHQALRDNKKFLVVEPAKGEYKTVFGGLNNVSVYGTNPAYATLLKLNPFSFPTGIHVLEHIDRLVEIFNACWPMYAAMPAVLKNAVEESYRACGWNLINSTNSMGVFPTFHDLLQKLPEILDKSEYSDNTKGDYKGALVTRVKSLTNGINGQIFTGLEEISSHDLFDKNVIVDLSRVGSLETKSLIMGFIVLKLQEYRMSTGDINSPLQHLTVLEEAHNLLRKTSSEQSQESGNLQGKSVEMLTNAIAEMRTYGEGFIIADQSPGLLDLSVIRNTNTKIVMRLPEQSDRDLLGNSICLTEEQTKELAKLERGVAAVYQNNWLEAVLCKVHHMDSETPYVSPSETKGVYSYETLVHIALEETTEPFLQKGDISAMVEWVIHLNLGMKTKQLLCSMVQGETLAPQDRINVLYNLTNGVNYVRTLVKFQDEDREKVLERIHSTLQEQYNLNETQSKDLCRILIEGVLPTLKSTETVEVLEQYKNLGGGF